MTLLVFFIILSVLVLVHELGHFIVAKRNGILVEEFGFGIPPRVLAKKWGDTTYSFNLLPFGGFVKLKGEDVLEDGSSDPTSFMSKSPGQRFRVLVAGVFMNLLLALGLWFTFFIFNGFKTFYIPLPFDYSFKYGNQHNINTVVANILPDSGAEKAGIVVGEAILSIDGIEVKNVNEVKGVLSSKVDVPVRLVVMDLVTQDPNSTREVLATPQPNEMGDPQLGVLLTGATFLSYDSATQRLMSAPMHAYNVLGYTGFALKELVRVSIEVGSSEPLSANVAGPVGIYSIVDSILSSGNSSTIMLSLLDYTALMSISLALINILPIPALDGGRILFVVIEKVTKKSVNQKLETFAHRIGMLLLLGLLVLVTIKDISRFF